MADDIDIEEHDGLYLRLKNINPDITNINTEIIANEDTENRFEGELLSYENSICQEVTTERNDDENQYNNNIRRNMIILGTRPSTSSTSSGNISSTPSTSSVTKSSTPSISSVTKSSTPSTSSGTKSSTPSTSSGIKTSTPSTSSGTNPSTSSTSSITISSTPSTSSGTKPSTSSPHSGTSTEMFTEVKKVSLKSDIMCIIHIDYQDDYLTCKICSCYFDSVDIYNSHMLENHDISVKNPIRKPYNATCAFCYKNIMYQTNYNIHIKHSHSDDYLNKQNAKKNPFQNSFGNPSISSTHSELIHRDTVVVSEKNIVHNDDVNMDASSASTSLTPRKQTRDTITYYYCSNCKSYTKFNGAKRYGHLSGACTARIKTWNVELCKLCGLTFTTKAMQSHKAYHKAGQIKLSNILFIDMLSGNKIKPPFPNFKACSKCRVRFYSATALKNHICNNAEYRACKYCKEKFNDLALKLHVPFHEYSNPSAVKLITQTQLIPPSPTQTEHEKLHPDKLINDALINKENVARDMYVLRSKSVNKMPDGMRKINRFPMKIRPKYNNSDLTFKTLLDLYKCRDCEVCVSKPSAFKHTCSKQNEKKQCTKCHLHFRKSIYTKHMRIHKQYPKMTKNNINITYFKNNRIDRGIINAKHKTMTAKQRQIINTQKVNNTNQNKMIFYECLQCHNVVYHEANVKRHNCGNRSIIKCPKCGIRVHGSHFNAHKQLHKQRKFNKTNVVIFKFKGEKIYKPIETENAEINEKHSEVIEKTNKVCAHLHKCTVCSLNFISRDRLLKHTLINKCGLEEAVECEFCNLKFDRTSILSHRRNHKYPEKIISLIIVTTLDIKDRLNIRSAKHWIFYCQQCDIYSLNYNSMKNHFVCDHKAYREPMYCRECKVKFIRNCYINHVDIHHNKLNLPVSKLNVEILVSSAIETTDMSQVDNEGLIDIDSFGDNNDNDEREINTETHLPTEFNSYSGLSSKRKISKTPIKNVDKKIMSIDPSTSNRVQNISSEPIKTSQSNVKPLKYFKCCECDVHFLKAGCCYEHTSNHSPLDPTEYTACKICGLQFLCGSLGKHMKGHREKNFNIDELVVDEYRINGNDITINTYVAADRMKS